MPADTINVPYNQTITAGGGTGTIGLAVSNIQNAIAGLVVPTNGTDSLTISGTPTASGTETFTVTATDSLGATVANYSHNGKPGITLSPPSCRPTRSMSAYNQTITAAAARGRSAGGKQRSERHRGPESCRPTAAAAEHQGHAHGTGTETFTVTATDSVGATKITNYSITVNRPVTLSPSSLPADTINVGYNQTITAGGGTGTIGLVVSNIQNAIPGLTVPASGTGSLVISGTPTATGTETFTVTATDSVGASKITNY